MKVYVNENILTLYTTFFGRFHDFSGEIVVVLVSFWLLTPFNLEGGLNRQREPLMKIEEIA